MRSFFKVHTFDEDILTVVNVGDKRCVVPRSRGILACGLQSVAPCHRLSFHASERVEGAHLPECAVLEIGQFHDGAVGTVGHLSRGDRASLGMSACFQPKNVVVESKAIGASLEVDDAGVVAACAWRMVHDVAFVGPWTCG